MGFTYSNQTVHSAAIAFLLWNPLGTRLVTGDKVRIVIIHLHMHSDLRYFHMHFRYGDRIACLMARSGNPLGTRLAMGDKVQEF